MYHIMITKFHSLSRIHIKKHKTKNEAKNEGFDSLPKTFTLVAVNSHFIYHTVA